MITIKKRSWLCFLKVVIPFIIYTYINVYFFSFLPVPPTAVFFFFWHEDNTKKSTISNQKGMAIQARPTGSRAKWLGFYPIRLKIRSGMGLTKKTRSSSGQVLILEKTWTRPDPFKLKIKLLKYVPIYISLMANLSP